MTLEERWMARHNVEMDFMEKNHRKPPKYYTEEKLIYHNKKQYNAGGLKTYSKELFEKLL